MSMMDPKLYQILLETFKGELLEQHQVMVDALMSLEKTKSKNKAQELLGNLFRISHNLKGSAKSVSKEEIAAIAHELEDVFTVWREKNEKPTKKEIDRCLKLADKMRDVFEASNKRASTSHGTQDAQDEMLKIPLRRVERVNSKINELALFQLRLSRWIKNINGVLNTLRQIKTEEVNALEPVSDELSQLFEESEKLVGEFSRDLFTLQQEGRMMQLVPIDHLLLPLKRTVREIADGLGKHVELVVEGYPVDTSLCKNEP